MLRSRALMARAQPATLLAHTMSLLVKKMNHGGPSVLSWPLIRAKCSYRARSSAACKTTRQALSLVPSKNTPHTFVTQKKRRPSRLLGNTITKARMQPHHETSSQMRTAGMEIVDREREREWLEQMDTILIFVCLTCFFVLAQLIGCPDCVVRKLLERFPHRTPQSSRTRPHGYHTGRLDIPNANDA